MVDTVNAKTDTLVNSFSDSNNLISLIVDINSSIAGSDAEIDHISDLIQRNSAYLSEFQTLYEKSFLLESNLDLQGSFTNESSYSRIYDQYYSLWNQFDLENYRQQPDSPVLDPVLLQGQLKNMLSISNLNLKPLKCKSTRVSKQKSRYRISEAYTLNPVQKKLRDVLENSTYTNASNIMECDTSKSSELASVSSYSDGGPDGWYDESTDYPTTALRANIEGKLDLDNVFEAPFYDISLLPLSFKSKHLSADVCDIDELNPEPAIPIEEHEFSDFENFHHFLRKSRIDLREAFPEPKPKRSPTPQEHAGVPPCMPPAFNNPALMIPSRTKQLSSQPTVEQVYSLSFDGSLKFSEHSKKLLGTELSCRNPLSSANATTPVKKQNYGLFLLLNSPLGSPRMKSNKPTCPQDRARPPPASESLLQGLPSKSFSSDKIGISLASSFLSLVGNGTVLDHAGISIEGTKSCQQKSPPAKIKKMKRNQKDPIAASNDIRSKRLPPVERGSRSSSSGSKDSGHGKDPESKKQFYVRRTTLLLKDAFNETILS